MKIGDRVRLKGAGVHREIPMWVTMFWKRHDDQGQNVQVSWFDKNLCLTQGFFPEEDLELWEP